VLETDLERYAVVQQYPIIPCNLCGSQDNLQRQAMKAMINEWDKTKKGWVESMFSAMGNIVPSHLMDGDLFDFRSLTVETEVSEGDIAFDEEPCATDNFKTDYNTRQEKVITFV
jgi:tRNA 2-thiocytidine biosynthesis protein TtcA